MGAVWMERIRMEAAENIENYGGFSVEFFGCIFSHSLNFWCDCTR